MRGARERAYVVGGGILHPVYSIHWSVDAESTFDALKHALITAPILRLPDFTKPFIVETDTSSYGVGAILSQDGHPISIFQRNSLHHLYHRSLRHLTNQTLQTITRGIFTQLLGYNLTIEYKAGNSNLAADGLSRSLHMSVSTSHLSMLSDIRDSLAASPYVSSLLNQIEKDPDGILPYFFKDVLLYWKRRVVVPPENPELITKLLVEFHSSPIGGHAGFLRTYARVVICSDIPNITRKEPKTGQKRTRERIEYARAGNYQEKSTKVNLSMRLASCQICQRAKSCQLQPAGLLSQLPIPNQTSIGMTPFKVLYGREPPSIIPSSAAMDTPNDVHTQLQARDGLVQWDGTDTTAWESWNTLQQKYPNLDLKEKVYFEEGRNVMFESTTDHELQDAQVAQQKKVGKVMVRKSNRVRQLPIKLRE
nr:hypothetical protein [Tanacetum cinerariifolium]